MPARLWRALPLGARDIIAMAGFAAAYFATAATSVSAFGTNTPIWFANALAVAWLLRERIRLLPAYLLALWLTDSLAIGLFGGPPAPVLALADLFEVSASVTMLRRIGGAEGALSSASGLVRFVLICAVVPIISASFGAFVLARTEAIAFIPQVRQWYWASTLGLLVVCPILMIWSTPGLVARPTRSQFQRSVFLAVGLAIVSLVVFRLNDPAFLFVIFPVLLLLVWHRGLVGASVGSSVVIAIGLFETLRRGGAIAALEFPVTDVASNVRALQIFLGALTLSSLPLAVVLTDQKRLSAQLARVAEARSEFLAAMSHEIRTPMTGVLGMVDLIDAEASTPRQRRQLASIRASGRHLLNVLNDILDFSRIETGRIELEQVDFSLPMLLEQVQAGLAPLACERGIELNVGLTDRSPPIVRGDPTRLKQILLNLAGNAIKFTPEGSVLILAAYSPRDEGAGFRFEIRDTGIGIAPEQQLHVFDAFTQADRSTSRRYGGSGLGLAISKRLVDAMGGEIGVESEPGAGSLFWFEIPLALGDVASLPHDGHADRPALAPRRILLAEDVDLNRDVIQAMLEREGHRVDLAKNGREALKRVRQNRYDLVLMDVHMPVMDGLAATRAIRALPGPASATPVIALTANVMATEQAKCSAAGMDEVLMKPIEWDRVRAAIARYGPAQVDGAADAPEAARFDQAVFDEIARMLPPERLQNHCESLEDDVSLLVERLDADDRRGAGQLAHRIVSQAGMLGLIRLSSSAAAVEQACRSNNGLPVARDQFQAARADFGDYLDPLLSARPI